MLARLPCSWLMNIISIPKVPYCKRLLQGEFPPLELGCAVATEKGNLAVTEELSLVYNNNPGWKISILCMALWDGSKDKIQATIYFTRTTWMQLNLMECQNFSSPPTRVSGINAFTVNKTKCEWLQWLFFAMWEAFSATVFVLDGFSSFKKAVFHCLCVLMQENV